jgi:membrane protein DedA with SNARE-associated domain/membrane-associated phospholipid phosphatase
MALIDIKPVFEWLQIHPFLAAFITYFITFFECLAILGLLVPGTVFMTAIGTLIGIGILPFTSITLWAIAGAITGDVLSFWLGRHYHEHKATLALFRRYPKLFKKGDAFFNKHGGKSIFIGRFIGPVRAILPFIAGMVHMPYRQFLVADVISAILWAPIYMLPGILLGQASQQLPPEVASKLILFVVLLLLVFWLIYSFIKSCYAWFIHLLDKQVAYLWHFTRNHPRYRPFSAFLMDPNNPHSHTQLALALVCIFSLLGFLFLAISVAHHGIATYFNEPVYYLMQSLRHPTLDKFFVSITLLSPRVLFIFWVLILGILLLKRNFWASLHWGLAGILCFALGDVFKYIMHIPRPSGLLQTPAGASFPSGHAVSSVSLLGFFSILCAFDRPKCLRILIYGLTIAVIFLILFSRIYLTAHWLTDILGGVLLGIAIITGLTLSYRRKKDKTNLSTTSFCGIALLILFFIWAVNLFHGYHQQFQAYQIYAPPPSTIELKNWWIQAKQQKPIYRINRFGHPIEILNIQWADELTTIQYNLEKCGWHVLPKTRLLTTLYHIGLRKHDPTAPLFISTNAGEKPTLTMSKYFPNRHTLLVLKLWKTPIRFSNGLPLLVGTVDYRKTWHLQFQPLEKQHPTFLMLASSLLQKDLQAYQTKNVSYSSSHAMVLFIKPSMN